MTASDPIRFLLRCAAFVPLALAIPLANWMVCRPLAPAVMMRDFDRMAKVLSAGDAIFTSVDARALKLAYLRNSPARPQVLILGSSRAYQISPDWFQPRSAWNASVGYGGIDDAVAYFQLCVETGKTPQSVVLEVNPTLMGGDVNLKDWRALSPYLDRAAERYHLSIPWRRRIPELASLRQLKWNLLTLKGLRWRKAQADRLEMGSVLPGGQVLFAPSLRRSDASIAGDLAKYPSREASRPGEFELELFHRFLDDLAARHIQVAIFLAPVHPLAYEYYSRRGGYDERWLRRDMAARGIPVAGSFSPVAARATREDFFDDVHPFAAICKRLLEEGGVIEAKDVTTEDQ